MAHIEKYKASATGGMLHHYQRDRQATLDRENVDETRTHLNYAIAFKEDGKIGRVPPPDNTKTVQERVRAVESATGRRLRKDAVVMADMVVTLPKNVPEKDALAFFAWSYAYMADVVGKDNLMGGYVHMDETTPHMHVPFTPIKDGRFSYKQLITRSVYQRFHKGLGNYLEKKMGYRPAVEVEDAGEKRMSRLSQEEYIEMDNARKAMKGEIASLEERRGALAEECEELRCKRDELGQQAEFTDSLIDQNEAKIAQLEADIAGLEAQKECLRRETEVCAGHVEELESAVADVRQAEGKGAAGTVSALDKLISWCDGFRAAIERRAGNLAEQIRRVKQAFLPPEPRAADLRTALRQAQEAAAVYNQQRPAQRHNRGIGR